jgi:RNA polymerase sigma factor (sigma-70 family)
MISSSLDLRSDTNRRLEHLYISHSGWLKSVANNITKDKREGEELVAELYLYLAERPNSNLWYSTSFNLMYLRAFIHSRFINGKKRGSKTTQIRESDTSLVYEEYDIESDERFEGCWNEMIGELESLKKEKNWHSALLFEHYYFNDDMTLQKLSDEIGISLSTTYMHTKRIKEHLKEKLTNPFKPKKD